MEAVSETAADCVSNPLLETTQDTEQWDGEMGAESCAAEEAGIRSGAAAAAHLAP